jgi:hypothetical protein
MNRHISRPGGIESPDIDTLSAEPWPSTGHSIDPVEDLFNKMQALYGAKFLEQWKDINLDALRQHWGSALDKMTPQQVQRGMASLELLDLPPTLPQFIKLCKPELDPQAAYLEAVVGIAAREQGDIGQWSDPAIYWATTAIGAFDLKTRPYAQIRRRWESALEEARAHPHSEPIPAPEVQRVTPEETEAPYVDIATELVAVEKAVEVARSVTARPDHKRWAKRIQERIAKGDKTVTKQQARAAKEALR